MTYEEKEALQKVFDSTAEFILVTNSAIDKLCAIYGDFIVEKAFEPLLTTAYKMAYAKVLFDTLIENNESC